MRWLSVVKLKLGCLRKKQFWYKCMLYGGKKYFLLKEAIAKYSKYVLSCLQCTNQLFT